MSDSTTRRRAPSGVTREGSTSISDNQYSVAEAGPEAFSEPICFAYRYRTGEDRYGWVLTFTDSERVHVGFSKSFDSSEEEIPRYAGRYGYAECYVIERAPWQAMGQPCPEEVARA